MLFWLLWLPYRLWEWTTDRSYLGRSPMDRETILFWRKFAIVGTVVVLMIAAAVYLWFYGITSR